MGNKTALCVYVRLCAFMCEFVWLYTKKVLCLRKKSMKIISFNQRHSVGAGVSLRYESEELYISYYYQQRKIDFTESTPIETVYKYGLWNPYLIISYADIVEKYSDKSPHNNRIQLPYEKWLEMNDNNSLLVRFINDFFVRHDLAEQYTFKD